MLVFLSQQAAELLVFLTEVGLTRREGLVALTQFLVQLSTNTNRTKGWKSRGRARDNQRWNVKRRNKSLIRLGHIDWQMFSYGGVFLFP